MVSAYKHVGAGPPFEASLAYEDFVVAYPLASEALDSQPLRVRVFVVFGHAGLHLRSEALGEEGCGPHSQC